MRTSTLENPTSWRRWNGDGFDLALQSPEVAVADVTPCELVVPFEQFGDTASLTYSTYLERYMSVDIHLSWETGEPVCGVSLRDRHPISTTRASIRRIGSIATWFDAHGAHVNRAAERPGPWPRRGVKPRGTKKGRTEVLPFLVLYVASPGGFEPPLLA